MLLYLYFVFYLIPGYLSSRGVIMDPQNPSKSKEESLVRSFFNDTRSYAGFFEIHETAFDDRLFFWFFPHHNETAPVIVWLQGQPGLSSLYSLFEEHGPYEIDGRNMKLLKREFSLTNTYHVLYLDPEKYCGFSSTNDSNYSLYKGLQDVPMQIHTILVNFFEIFSEYRKNDLYIAGASANCRVICELARYEYTMKQFNESKLNIQGLIIGGGFFTPERTFHYLYALHWNGIVDSALTYSLFRMKHYNILRYIQARQHLDAMEEIGSMLSKLRYQGYKTIYDVRNGESLVSSYVPDFVSKSEVREALHVSDWPFQNETQIIVKDSLLPVENLYSMVFASYKILLYHGQFDLLSTYANSAEFLTSLSWPDVETYYDADRVNWIHNGNLLGYWTQAGNLTHALIRDAGHFVGKDQPEALYLLFDKFIRNNLTSSGH